MVALLREFECEYMYPLQGMLVQAARSVASFTMGADLPLLQEMLQAHCLQPPVLKVTFETRAGGYHHLQATHV